MKEEKAKPQIILDLEKALGIEEVNGYELNEEGDVVMLDLSYKDLADISYLSSLVNLKQLHLRGNNLTDISYLSSLVNLKELYLSSNDLTNISSLSNLVNLNKLDLRNNDLTDISCLSGLVNLEGLFLRNNKLINISYLSRLVNINDLDLYNTQLTDISFLSSFHNLSFLNLRNNGVIDICSLSSLVNLKILFLSNNKLTDISSLSGLVNLNVLDLSANELTDISSLSNLVDLNYLDLRNNQLTQISKELINKFTIKDVIFIDHSVSSSLNLYGNPLSPEMIEAIKSGGKDALLQYLEAQEKGTVKIEEAKMVLLGEPRAGKTTLQKYLMGLPINENETSTPDIQISTWRPFETENERCDTKINLWDFGGQEIQYSLHKLFMTTDTLYIIVLDSTKDQSPNKYLAFLENYAPKAPFIIINNYADVATTTHLKIDENYLRETYDGKDEKLPVLKAIFNRVSIVKAAKNDISWRKIMDEVVDTIKTELLSLDNLNKEFPIEYQKVKQAIESEYLKPDRHYITMSYYRELCKSLEVTDTEDRRIAILLFLNQIGVLRYFNDSALTDKHILNPKWLIDGAYSLIIDESTALNHGVLSKNQALSILKRSNNFKFYEEEAEFIFKTMNIYGLLHFEESEQKLYIPIRFGSNQPISLNEFYEEGKHFTFEFKTDIPEDIMPTLIVRHFGDIQNKHYWSKGAVFTKDDIRCLARVEDRTIHFYIIGQFHQSYFYSLRSTLIKNLEKLSGLQYEEWVEFDFNGKKIEAKYIALINFLKKNRNEYIDDANDVEIPKSFIIEILGGYFSQQAINQVTNNIYHGDVTFNDNRYQQISILNQLQSLADTSQDPNDQQELKGLIEEFKAFSKEKTKDKKEGLAKKLFVKIKKIGEEVADNTIKDKLKEVFPTILNYGVNYLKDIDLDKLIKIFEQQM